MKHVDVVLYKCSERKEDRKRKYKLNLFKIVCSIRVIILFRSRYLVHVTYPVSFTPSTQCWNCFI